MAGTGSHRPGFHPALITQTGFLLSRLGLLARNRFGERIQALGLTARMWGALNVLAAEGPLTQLALGHSIGMDPSSMVSTLDELEAKGMVQRHPHPSDRRAHAVHLTPGGEAVLGRGRAVAREAQEELLAPLDAQERRQLHALLLRLAQGSRREDGATGSAGAVR
ncbi:MAG: MarR family winged helix-turn-helix transcriptional regulator [Actinomycetota bacterium]|nr:MarR family winged helix-turn-helix transcriptional regulator [Actinomycetota bacterium]